MNIFKHGKRLILVIAMLVAISILLKPEPALAHPGHGNHFLNLSEHILTPQLTITGLSLSFAFGAVHGLTPGHGKTIATAYLIGSKATPSQALLLSAVTTLTHTGIIFLLGLAIAFASRYLLPEQLYYIFSLLSGITISAIGFWRLESYFNPHPEHHTHSHHEGSAIALGIAGGLTPCSEALVLLLGAICIHREIYGLELVAVFSLGLGAILTIIGLITVYCRDWLDRLPQSDRLKTYFPLVSAIAISIAGLILTTEAII